MSEKKISRLKIYKSALKLAKPIGYGLVGAGIAAAGVMALWAEGAGFAALQGTISSYMPIREALEYATGASILIGGVSTLFGGLATYEEQEESIKTIKTGIKQLKKKR